MDSMTEDPPHAGEFLQEILKLFNVNIAKKQTISYVTNNIKDDFDSIPEKDLIKIDNIVDDKASISWFIDSLTLNERPNLMKIEDLLEENQT